MNRERGFILKADYVEPIAAQPAPAIPGPSQLESSVTAAAMQQLIDDLPEQVALLDADFSIVAVNRAWTEEMTKLGYPQVMPGGNYRRVAAEYAAAGYAPAIRTLAALDQIAAGTRIYWQLIFNGRDKWSDHRYQLSFHRVSVGTRSFITVTRFELTENMEFRHLKSQIKASFVNGQVAERERMGRELHDSTSQQLALVEVLLARLKRISRSERLLKLLSEVQSVVRETQEEIRSISYLARPPALERSGLADAVKTLVQGFGQRSGLIATFEIQGEIPALPQPVEHALYRVVQEALANVQRHARASQVRLLLRCRRSILHLLVVDNGKGISPETRAGMGRAGMGICSMRSRLAEIGGRLTIRTLCPGTAIMASLRSPTA